MRHIFIICFLVLLAPSMAQTSWTKVFSEIAPGGRGSVMEVIECPNGDLVLAGGNGDPYGEAIAFLMRLNASGDVLWYKEYEGFHSFASVIRLATGELLAGGLKADPISSVLKTDSLGNVIQAINIDCDYFGNVRSIAKSDSGFICLAGFVWELNTSLTDVNWVQRLQSNGAAGDISKTPDGFILTGTGGNVSVNPTSGNDISLTKIDEQGNFQWSKSFGGMRSDNGRQVTPTQDGGFLIGGWGESFDDARSKYFLIKTDSLGTYQWGKTYRDTSYGSWGHCILEDDAGNFYIGGIHLGEDVMIVKTDPTGQLIWSKTFNPGTAYSMIQSNDGGLVVAGATAYNEHFIYKMDTAGNNACGQNVNLLVEDRPYGSVISPNGWGILTTVFQDVVVTTEVAQNPYSCEFVGNQKLSIEEVKGSIKVYPNPTNGRFKVVLPESESSVQIKVTDLTGKVLMEKNFQGHIFEAILENSKGVYLISVIGEHTTYCERLLIE